MFETHGTLNQEIVEELLPKDLPHLNQVTYILVIAFVLLATLYPFGSLPFTLILLCALLPLIQNKFQRQKYITANMRAIYAITGGKSQLEVCTIFEEDFASMSFQDIEVKLNYTDFHRILETASVFCFSTVAHQAVYVFKNQLSLDQQHHLFSFLHEKNTQIPGHQFQPYTKEDTRS